MSENTVPVTITKLITGEEIVAVATPMEAKGQPLLMLLCPLKKVEITSDRGYAFSYVEFMPEAKDAAVPIPLDSVMTQCLVNEDTINLWNDHKNELGGNQSGLIVPEQKIVLQ